MTDIVIKAGDTPSGLAKTFVGNANKWPEFCKANPQFKAHPTYGCVFFAGNNAHLPANWPVSPGGSPPAPIPGPVPQPVGPPIPTPGGDAISPAQTDTITPGGGGLFAGLDTQKVMIGGAVIAGAIVLLYAMKKKTRSAAAA